MHALLVCKIFGLKIRSCKIFDKSHVCVVIVVIVVIVGILLCSALLCSALLCSALLC